MPQYGHLHKTYSLTWKADYAICEITYLSSPADKNNFCKGYYSDEHLTFRYTFPSFWFPHVRVVNIF